MEEKTGIVRGEVTGLENRKLVCAIRRCLVEERYSILVVICLFPRGRHEAAHAAQHGRSKNWSGRECTILKSSRERSEPGNLADCTENIPILISNTIDTTPIYYHGLQIKFEAVYVALIVLTTKMAFFDTQEPAVIAVDRLHRFRWSGGGGGSNKKSSSGPRSEKTERLRELTEKLKGPAPVPPPRRPSRVQASSPPPSGYQPPSQNYPQVRNQPLDQKLSLKNDSNLTEIKNTNIYNIAFRITHFRIKIPKKARGLRK